MGRGTYFRTQKSRDKSSKSHIGIHPSPGTLEKFRINRTGKRHSEETKRRIGLGNLGKIVSQEAKLKMSKSKRGSLSPTWKGGITPIHDLIRGCNKYKEWHQNVLIRDGFVCRQCGIIGGKLHVHHIKNFYILLDEIRINLPLLNIYEAALIYTPLWDTTNGKTLCENCHKIEHCNKKIL